MQRFISLLIKGEKWFIDYMNDDIDKIMFPDFANILKEKPGQSLKEIWLFGSRARGDNDDFPDYDVLVVAEGEMSVLRDTIKSVDWEMMEKYGKLVSSIVYTPEIWKKAKLSPLGINILKEGVLVA